MCDFEQPTFYNIKDTTAKKLHICCECGGKIKRGNQYEYVSGKWEIFTIFKTCAECVKAREKFMAITQECFCHGGLYEQLQEAVQYIQVGTGTKFSLYRELVKMDERRNQGSKQ